MSAKILEIWPGASNGPKVETAPIPMEHQLSALRILGHGTKLEVRGHVCRHCEEVVRVWRFHPPEVAEWWNSTEPFVCDCGRRFKLGPTPQVDGVPVDGRIVENTPGGLVHRGSLA